MQNVYSYLTEENVVEVFKTSRQYTEGLTDSFHEFERLARNKPHGSIPKELPKTTDGTTASIIRKTPHRIIQQLPTGTVTSDTNDWLSVVAGFIYTNKIIPNANEGYALLQKCWSVVEKSLTFGFCATYAPFVEHGGYFCTDLRLPYWGDIFVQPGKLSDQDSNYMFLRSWWQTKDIDALIDSQSKLDKKTEKTWNVANLNQIKTMESTKDEKAKTPAERDKNINTKGGVELITGFQRGKGAKFFTFHVSSGLIVRVKENKDPRGEIPVSFAYGDVDGSNPFGRSIIELVGSMQNLMDAEMQMYQYNRALMLNPPLIKRGNFSKNKIKFSPNTIIDVGADQNATVEPLKIDTTAIQGFPNNYGLMKSQMLNLLASPDTSISADVGNPGFSKTPQGVEASRANLSVDDNYVRKQFETWFERWSETAVNIYFAERSGVEELQLDTETADKLRDLAEDGRFDASLLSEDNMIRINYDTETEKLEFRVNPSTSKKDDDVAQLTLIQGALKTVTPQVSYYMGQDGWKFKTGEAYRIMLEKMGIENIGEIVTKMNANEAKQAKQQPFPIIDPPQIRLTGQIPNAAMSAALQQGGVAVDPNTPNLNDQLDLGDIYKDPSTPASVKAQIQQKAGLQPDPQGTATQQQSNQPQQQDPVSPELLLKAQQQVHSQAMDKAKLGLDIQEKNPQPPLGLHPADQQIIQQLQHMGASEQQIGQAIALLHSGASIPQIMQMLGVQQWTTTYIPTIPRTLPSAQSLKNRR